MIKTFNIIACILIILVGTMALMNINDKEPILQINTPKIAFNEAEAKTPPPTEIKTATIEVDKTDMEQIEAEVLPIENITIKTAPTNQCDVWLNQAGITGQELTAAKALLKKENAGCDPQLYNMAGSDACGIAQELPCGKSGCGLPPNADGACQVRWQKEYIKSRYGSYANALSFHNINNWY